MAEASDKSGDVLLVIGAVAVVAMGIAWLVIEALWNEPEPLAADLTGIGATLANGAAPAARSASSAAPGHPGTVAAEPQSSGSDPLQLAALALEAGMLIEPAEYSAWALFGRVADADPGNEAASAGLLEVAEALLVRGAAALEQGRYDDAAALAATVVARLPEHVGARDLNDAIELARKPPEPPPAAPRTRTAARAAPVVDPVPALNDAFFAAMAANAVLAPPGSSAIDIVGRMLESAPQHKLTIAARDMLVTEMLDRSVQSLEARDIEAARTWIDSAAPLAADPARVDAARDRLTAHLIETESQKLLPASAFTQTHYAAPEFPRVALDRGVGGWVDVEFMITESGDTASVHVIDGSHERYFRDEAVAAVLQWRFEPDLFMDRPIARRAFTRLAFVID